MTDVCDTKTDVCDTKTDVSDTVSDTISDIDLNNKDYIFEFRTVQSSAFRVLIEALKEILTDKWYTDILEKKIEGAEFSVCVDDCGVENRLWIKDLIIG